MEDNKSILQNYVQCRGGAVPTYKNVRVGGEDHTPIWSAIVRITPSLTFQGEPSPSKKEAHFSAAGIALKRLREAEDRDRSAELLLAQEMYPIKESHTQKTGTTDSRRVLLVDVENIPNFIYTLFAQYAHLVSDLDIHAFVGEHSPLVTKDYSRGVVVHIVPGTHRDGADCCLTVFTGFLLSQGEYDIYYIATRDHFAVALCEMIRAPDMPWGAKRGHIVSQPLHINKD